MNPRLVDNRRAAPERRTMPAVGPRRHRPDYWLVILCAALLAIGLVVVYAISPGLSAQKGVGENYYIGKQLLAVGLGVGAFLVSANLPLGWWRRLEKPLIILAVLSAAAVRVAGQRINGAYRWVQIGGFSFQAAELIKLALLIWLAGFLVDRLQQGTLAEFKTSVKPLLIALGVLAVIVAGLQSDLGSMGVMVAMMAAMVFVAGMPLKRVAIIGGLILIGTILAVSTSGYRRARVMTYLHPASDCQSSGYQSCQALITVGSGGLFGLGLGRSVQAFGYLPEAANDSIFAIMAEKFGFIGISIILTLFVAFFGRLKRLIERAPDDYSRLLVTGILAWLSTQTIINIGAMLGLLPLKGITLPFISSGGTSLLFITGAVGIVFQVSRYATYGRLSNTQLQGTHYEDRAHGRRLRGAYHPAAGRRP